MICPITDTECKESLDCLNDTMRFLGHPVKIIACAKMNKRDIYIIDDIKWAKIKDIKE